MTDRPDLRASDADRERTVAQLRDHAATGRLTVEELDERSAAAYAARTGGELARLLADLPAPAPARPPAASAADPGGLGRRPFTFVFDHAAAPGRATDEALRLLAPALAGGGCRLSARDERRLELEYSYRPGWVALPIILVPIPGLLLLLLKQHDRVLVDVEESPGGGIRVLVHGRAPRRVRRAFAALGR